MNAARQLNQSRIEKRKNDALKADVDETYSMLINRFLDYFTESENPEGQDLQNKIATICAQWRAYCTSKHLIPALHNAMDTYIDDVLKAYTNVKESKKAGPATQNTQDQGVSESPRP